MSRFIDEADRSQGTLLPETIDEYVCEENPVRVIDAFVCALDLASLGFEGVEPEATGRPAYHPATMLKIYLYGYLNRIQSTRRLEQEARRNLELMWLVGRLAPDFKTLADFRAENTVAIKNVCREFIRLCRRWNLFSEATVAIDGSKFKAVNHRDRNFTSGKMKTRMALIEQSIVEYLEQLDRMDRRETPSSLGQTARLKERIATLKDEMSRLERLKARMETAPDGQVSLTDPDARSMASQGKGTGIVGYNVQAAVDTQRHLIVAHEVTNVGSDRHQLKRMSEQARDALGSQKLTVLADRGYYSGEEIKACDDAGIVPLVPKVLTSNSKARVATTRATSYTSLNAMRSVARPASMRSAGSRASRKAWRFISTGRQRVRAAPCGRSARHQTTDASAGGARGGARQDAGTARRQSRGDAGATANRRASVRDDQGLDGRHALLVSTTT